MTPVEKVWQVSAMAWPTSEARSYSSRSIRRPREMRQARRRAMAASAVSGSSVALAQARKPRPIGCPA